jgi:uncharacterized protein (TIGR00661 family)
MKILYGIQLNGNGHITRSVELISVLKEKGFDIDIVTSGNNSNLKIPFDVKDHFSGISIYYNKKGSINWIKTLSSVRLLKLIKDTKYDVSEYDLVISDFEPISAWSAKRKKVRSIGISNQYSLLSDNVPVNKKGKIISKLFVKYFAPCSEYIALNYKKYDEFIYQPFVSKFFLNNKPKDEDFYLVYLPSLKLEFILNQINLYSNIKWKVYTDEVNEVKTIKNTTIKPLDKSSFQKDLLNCSGVVTASGFSTTSEALILNKKLWSIPLEGQYEQISNSIALEEMGVYTKKFNSSTISEWIISYNVIKYDWKDPIEDIVKIITKH